MIAKNMFRDKQKIHITKENLMLNFKNIISAALAAALALAPASALASETAGKSVASFIAEIKSAYAADDTYDTENLTAPAGTNESGISSAPVVLLSDITGIDDISLQSEFEVSKRNAILDYFREQTEAFADTIYLSEYNIKIAGPDDPSDYESLMPAVLKIYEALVYSSPRSYYLMADNGQYTILLFNYDTRSDGIYLTDIMPYYYIDIYDDSQINIDPSKVENVKPTVEAKQRRLDAEVEYAKLFINEGMSDTEKLVALQYMINLRYSYSYEDFEKPFAQRKNNTAIQLVENRRGMCVAYATLFNYLAMEIGITETGFVTSKDANGNDYHTWNLIKASTPATGYTPRWYNIDTTWDDTINAGNGTSGMAYFFLSTGKTNESHNLYYDDKTQYVFAPSEEEVRKYTGEATDTTFDDAMWHNSASVMVPYAEKWYFIMHQSGEAEPSILYRYDPEKPLSDGRYTALYTFKEEWTENGAVLDHSYTGLGIVNGVLYFNGPTSILSYDLIKGKPGEEIEVPLNNGDSIYSSYTAGSTMYYFTGKNIENTELNTYKLADITMADAKLRDNRLIFKLDTYAPENKGEDVTVVIKDGSRLIAENRTVNSYIKLVDGEIEQADPQSSWFTFTLEECDADNPPVIYIWGKNNKPYIASFCIDNTVYTHDGNGGAEPLQIN